MKKLIIAACAIAFAAAAQAANVDWKWTSTFYDHANSDAAYNGTVYVINANSYTQQTVLDAILNGGDLTDYIMGSGISTSNGKAPTSASVIGASGTFAPTRIDAETGLPKVDFYYAALTTDGDGKAYLFLGSTQNATLDSTADTHLSKSLSASKTSIDGSTFSSQGWYNASAVPEPTSGLLLLLGVAGLALRRRRA